MKKLGRPAPIKEITQRVLKEKMVSPNTVLLNLHKYKELLLVAGDQAPRYVGNLMVLLEKFPEIKFRVTAATHLRSTRWDIRLDGKIDVKLPEKEAERALGYLYDLEKHHHLMEQEEILTIDLRLPDQLILRLTPEAAQRKNNTGQDA